MSALYWNDPYGALELATQAADLVEDTPCIAAAWAPAVQARAYSRLGPEYADAVRAHIGRAEDAYSVIKARPGEQYAYGYTVAQLHFYRGNALTEIGDTQPAYQAQDAALTHYGPTAFLDSSLVRLDRAICLAKDGEPEEAARFARKALTALPESHVSPIIVRRANQFVAAIPLALRSLSAVQEFSEVLAIEAITK